MNFGNEIRLPFLYALWHTCTHHYAYLRGNYDTLLRECYQWQFVFQYRHHLLMSIYSWSKEVCLSVYLYLCVCLSVYMSVRPPIQNFTVVCWNLAVFSLSWSLAQSVGLVGLGSARRKVVPWAKQNKRTQTPMPQLRFESMTSVFEWAKPVYALDRQATSIGKQPYLH